MSELPQEAIPEVSEYLQQSFGDRERIDYGSGHELNFICWLYVSRQKCTNPSLCLRELHLLTQEDYKSLVLIVFNKFSSFIVTLLTVDISRSHDESKRYTFSNRLDPMAYGVSTIIPSYPTSSDQVNFSTIHTSVQNQST